jgi:sporulation-control protein spo0M
MLSYLKMPRADVTLDVKGGPFHPGDIMNLAVSISSRDSFTLRSASVELKCIEVYWVIVSQGKSTRQQKTKRNLFEFEEQLLGSTKLTPGMALYESASFTLPADIPPTICGKTVNISWQLDVKLNAAKMRDIHEKREVAVLPIATGIPVTEGSGRSPAKKVTASSGDGELVLTIDSEYGTAGKTLHGSLEAAVKKDISFSGVRAELEVKESAGVKSSKTAADLVMLEEESSLAAGNHRQWSFDLKFPDSAPPSFAVSNSRVEWNVKGIIDKSMRTDFSVSCPIQVS